MITSVRLQSLLSFRSELDRITAKPYLLTGHSWLDDTVGLVVWTAAEMAVTLICIGIPASRSLCKYFRARLMSEYSSDYKKTAEHVYGLRTIGGGSREQRGSRQINAHVNTDIDVEEHTDAPRRSVTTGRTVGLTSSCTTISHISGPERKPQQGLYTQSDEEILLGSAWGGGRGGSSPPTLDRRIRITEELRITRS